MFNIYNPLSDMVNRILISQKMKLKYVFLPYSNLIVSILNILKIDGYIGNIFFFFLKFNFIIIKLKYYFNEPLINVFKLISKNNVNIYKNYKNIPYFMNRLTSLIVSTNLGVINSKFCKILGIGGKLVCYVF